ncbi:MAG: GTP-binding protein, partial [Methylocystaceae bacterium]
VVMVLDISAGLSDEDEDILAFIQQQQKPTIFFVNKIDLLERRISEAQLVHLTSKAQVIPASVKADQGVEDLVEAIFNLGVGQDLAERDPGFLANLRQKAALERTLASLDEIRAGIVSGISLDCLAVDVMIAQDNLGEVTGRSIKEEIIDRIFSEFCIGK